MSELTNADRLIASTTSWRIMGEITFLDAALPDQYVTIKLILMRFTASASENKIQVSEGCDWSNFDYIK